MNAVKRHRQENAEDNESTILFNTSSTMQAPQRNSSPNSPSTTSTLTSVGGSDTPQNHVIPSESFSLDSESNNNPASQVSTMTDATPFVETQATNDFNALPDENEVYVSTDGNSAVQTLDDHPRSRNE